MDISQSICIIKKKIECIYPSGKSQRKEGGLARLKNASKVVEDSALIWKILKDPVNNFGSCMKETTCSQGYHNITLH